MGFGVRQLWFQPTSPVGWILWLQGSKLTEAGVFSAVKWWLCYEQHWAARRMRSLQRSCCNLHVQYILDPLSSLAVLQLDHFHWKTLHLQDRFLRNPSLSLRLRPATSSRTTRWWWCLLGDPQSVVLQIRGDNSPLRANTKLCSQHVPFCRIKTLL